MLAITGTITSDPTKMNGTRRVTIKDVARAAGVSTQTVSRVINNRPDVSSETRKHVQNIIERLGYAPNVIARSLSRGRSNTLGVVGFGLQYFGSSGVLTGIEKKSSDLGFSLLLSLLDKFESSRADQILRGLLSRQVEGIIWAVPGIDQILEWLSAKFENISVPVVFMNKFQSGEDVVVAMDNRLGGALATEHLLDQGYHRIGIITGPANWWEAQQREAGWREAMQQAGIRDLEDLIVEGDWSAASGEVGLHNLLAKSPHVEAIFASNDQMALGALQAARRMGLSVPQDIGLVGFDDIPEAPYFYPALTTVRQDLRILGALAVERMCDLIRARQREEEFVTELSWVRPRLVVRRSSIKSSD
jgi:DNA-binding LacI/PurR family transcriptional regulator